MMMTARRAVLLLVCFLIGAAATAAGPRVPDFEAVMARRVPAAGEARQLTSGDCGGRARHQLDRPGQHEWITARAVAGGWRTISR